jgi:CRISPR-associated protein Cas2
MPMVLIDLLDAPAVLEGQISRKLLEIRAGVYVGSLSKRQMETVWAAVIDAKPRAALLVYAAKNEIGIAMKSIGEHRYRVVDSDGLPLVSYRKE